ncbi:MAG: hypothetical protein ACLT9K_06745, partial [Clostridium sp.]
MKKVMKRTMALVVGFSLVVAASTFPTQTVTVHAAKAKIKLNKTSVTMKVGKKSTVKIKNKKKGMRVKTNGIKLRLIMREVGIFFR